MPISEREALSQAIEHGGFRDENETEWVSRWALAEIKRLREALQSIAGKPNPSGAYCQRVARSALGQDLNAS